MNVAALVAIRPLIYTDIGVPVLVLNISVKMLNRVLFVRVIGLDMERINAKEYLLTYRKICRDICLLEADIDEIISSIQRAPDNDGIPCGTDVSDLTGNIAARLADLKIDRESLITIRWRKRDEIIRYLLKMNDTLRMALLFERYVFLSDDGELKTWHDVAAALYVSEDYARGRLHAAALQEFERIINNE